MRWLWDQPEISVVLSGMSAMEHVVENVANAERSGIGVMNEDEQALIVQARQTYENLCPIPCTRCEYCLPCAVGLNIPRLFETLNRGVMYDTLDEARRRYERMSDEEKASACIACRQCEEKCPQSIPISEWMVHLDEILGEGMDMDTCLEQMGG